MSPKRVLVIAPDNDLRLSLCFALEAEGFSVTSRSSTAGPLSPDDFDCTVIDHHGLGAHQDQATAFVADFSPVILLANGPHRLSSRVFMTLVKPDLGAGVGMAVRRALRMRGATK